MSLDQNPHGFDDLELEQAFHRLEAESHTLNPASVIAGGRRRRVRHRIAVAGGAALATVVVMTGITMVVASDDAREPTVAQQPSAVEAKPLPRIADDQWFKLSARQWFRHSHNKWRFGNAPDTKKWLDRDTIQAADLSRGWVGPSTSGVGARLESATFIRGEVQRVVYLVKGDNGVFRHDARIYRLAAMPGWVLAYAEYGAPGPVSEQGVVENLQVGLEAFAADGRRLLHCDHDRPPVTSKAEAAARPPLCTAG